MKLLKRAHRGVPKEKLNGNGATPTNGAGGLIKAIAKGKAVARFGPGTCVFYKEARLHGDLAYVALISAKATSFVTYPSGRDIIVDALIGKGVGEAVTLKQRTFVVVAIYALNEQFMSEFPLSGSHLPPQHLLSHAQAGDNTTD